MDKADLYRSEKLVVVEDERRVISTSATTLCMSIIHSARHIPYMRNTVVHVQTDTLVLRFRLKEIREFVVSCTLRR